MLFFHQHPSRAHRIVTSSPSHDAFWPWWFWTCFWSYQELNFLLRLLGGWESGAASTIFPVSWKEPAWRCAPSRFEMERARILMAYFILNPVIFQSRCYPVVPCCTRFLCVCVGFCFWASLTCCRFFCCCFFTICIPKRLSTVTDLRVAITGQEMWRSIGLIGRKMVM